MEYGDIFKEITLSKTLPQSIDEVWNILKKTRNVNNIIHLKKYGSNLTLQEGSVFSHNSYETDIDSYLKK